MSTPITLSGNTTSEPPLRYTSRGTAVAHLTVAGNTRRRDGERWVDGPTTFYAVTEQRPRGGDRPHRCPGFETR